MRYGCELRGLYCEVTDDVLLHSQMSALMYDLKTSKNNLVSLLYLTTLASGSHTRVEKLMTEAGNIA